jgi:ABC-type multidrug transport system ATPase subunit
MLERFGLWRARNERAGTLSRGLLQRLALCRTFLHDPDVLLLDEPFDGLDDEGAELLQAELAERAAVTALVATHDPEALAERATARLALA